MRRSLESQKPGTGRMMRGKTSENREKILATALSLFTERGFFGTPTSLISKEAGVATGTLFFYFQTKEELIDTLYRRIKSEAAQAMCRGFATEKTAKARIRLLGNQCSSVGNTESCETEVHGTVRPFPVRLYERPRGGHVPLPLPGRPREGRDPRGSDPGHRPVPPLLHDGLFPLRPDRTGLRHGRPGGT